MSDESDRKDSERKSNEDKLPWERDDLDPNSTYAPSWHDPARIMEQIVAEASQIESVKEDKKQQGSLLEVPESEKSVAELSFGQRLVSLLFACGAGAYEIGLELKLTAQEVSRFENNRLITEQINIYKERFFSSDPQSQLKQMLPDGIKFLQTVLADKSIVDADKKLDTVKWLVEKITGKAVQQVDVSASLNFGHLLEEMKRMREVREAISQGAQHALTGSHELRDVTPPGGPKTDKYQDWISDWEKREGNPS